MGDFGVDYGHERELHPEDIEVDKGNDPMTEATKEMTGKEQFEAHYDALAGTWKVAAEWQRELRAEAIARFAELGFPTPRQEEWRQTNVESLAKTALSGEAGVPDAKAVAAALAKNGIDSLGGARLVFVNGRHAPEHSTLENLPKGAIARPMCEALADDGGEALEAYLGRVGEWRDHPFAALNTALFGDGLFLSLPAECVVERPIHLLFLNGGGGAFACHPRNLILVGRGGKGRLVESYGGIDDSVYFTNAVTEVEMGEGSYFDHYKLQRESRRAFHFQTLATHQHGASKFDTHALTEGGRLGRNDINSTIDGEGCDTILNGLYMLTDDQLFDTHTLLDHAKPHCHSREIYKGILGGRSRAIFRGKILVRQHAQKTDAVQSSKNLLISDEAQVNAQPQLEIYADDVKCTHGATIGQLNQESYFYAQSRGLDTRQARAVLTFAFANENLTEVCEPAVRDHLERLIHAWLEAHGHGVGNG
jgi:Fe-S cluster assembly protein SufD